MFSYVAYGLGIHSALPLPDLVAADVPADVVVRLGSVPQCPAEITPIVGGCCRATAEEAHLSWPDVGTFVVRRGCEILISPAIGAEEQVLRLFLLGPALAVALQQRGRLILHASAVALADGVVAFLGGPGWGKSSTAAALHAQGHALVADDVVAVDFVLGRPLAFPGAPQLKLWPDAAIALGENLGALPLLHPRLEKRGRPIARPLPQTPLPLERIYVLARGAGPAIEPLQPQAALMELVRHTYAARLLPAVGAATHFLQCARLANTVTISRLQVPHSLDVLPALARLVEEDVASGAGAVRSSSHAP